MPGSYNVHQHRLTSLNLSLCSLDGKDHECLANSKHSDTLLQLNLTGNDFGHDSAALGLILLCHKLKNVKVLTLVDCSLDKLSTHSVSKLIKAFKDCKTVDWVPCMAHGLHDHINMFFMTCDSDGEAWSNSRFWNEWCIPDTPTSPDPSGTGAGPSGSIPFPYTPESLYPSGKFESESPEGSDLR